METKHSGLPSGMDALPEAAILSILRRVQGDAPGGMQIKKWIPAGPKFLCHSPTGKSMAQPTFSESLAIQYPQLRQLSKYYEELGLEEPIQWAYSEMTGEAAVATAALVHALSSEVCEAGDTAWIGLMQSSAMNVGNPAIAAQASATLAGLAAQGVDLSSLTPLVRAIQAQVVRNIATLLDEGPEVCCIPLPPGREVGWGMSGTARREGIESPAQRILGLYGIIDGSGRI